MTIQQQSIRTNNILGGVMMSLVRILERRTDFVDLLADAKNAEGLSRIIKADKTPSRVSAYHSIELIFDTTF